MSAVPLLSTSIPTLPSPLYQHLVVGVVGESIGEGRASWIVDLTGNSGYLTRRNKWLGIQLECHCRREDDVAAERHRCGGLVQLTEDVTLLAHGLLLREVLSMCRGGS